MATFKRILKIALCISLIATTALLAADKTEEEKAAQAKESEARAKETAKTKPTPKMIIDKVNEAAKLLEKEGSEAFDKFKGKDSKFIFAGTYIWLHDMKGVMKMHPIKYKMEGKALIGLKDKKGKLFFAEMNKLVREKGKGWVDYMWPKPGEKTPSQKVSYVKLCKIKGGEEIVIGCGVYDLPAEEVKKLLENK